MIKVNILFFGATAEATNQREIELSFAADTTSAAAFDAVKTKYPSLNAHKLLYAVNQEYSDGTELIQNGDELAIFTAVSGG